MCYNSMVRLPCTLYLTAYKQFVFLNLFTDVDRYINCVDERI